MTHTQFLNPPNGVHITTQKKNEKLELVHTYVWGSDQVQSLDCCYYYVTFIDDVTKKYQVYCIRHKYNVLPNFKKWKALVENEIGKNLKCIRSDSGGEQ